MVGHSNLLIQEEQLSTLYFDERSQMVFLMSDQLKLYLIFIDQLDRQNYAFEQREVIDILDSDLRSKFQQMTKCHCINLLV